MKFTTAVIQNSTENMIQAKNDENSGRNNNDNNTSNGGKSRKRPGKMILFLTSLMNTQLSLLL